MTQVGLEVWTLKSSKLPLKRRKKLLRSGDVPLAEDLTAEALLQRAEKAEAADAYEEAETAEQEGTRAEELRDRTDIQLGLLLVKRGVKPGVFANQHGEKREETIKANFRSSSSGWQSSSDLRTIRSLILTHYLKQVTPTGAAIWMQWRQRI